MITYIACALSVVELIVDNHNGNGGYFLSLAVIGLVLYSIFGGKKRRSTQKTQEQQTAKGANHSQSENTSIYELHYYGSRGNIPLATFSNGYVYYKGTKSIIGSYDSNGKVFRKDGCLIGEVRDDVIYLDRHFKYESWCEIMSSNSGTTEFAKELKSRPGIYVPYMRMMAANMNGAWIESKDSDGIDYYGDPKDLVGSAAAFIVLIEDELVEDKRCAFYKSSNLQNEYYFRKKIAHETGTIGKYIRYFQSLYGDYPGADMN